MKRLKKRAVILLAAAAMFTVSPTFAANQNGKGHSEDGRGVSGSTGNQGNDKGVGNAGGNKGNGNNGGGNNGNGNGGSNSGGSGSKGHSGGSVGDKGSDSSGYDGAERGSNGDGNYPVSANLYEIQQVSGLTSTCEMYPTLWFCPKK